MKPELAAGRKTPGSGELFSPFRNSREFAGNDSHGCIGVRGPLLGTLLWLQNTALFMVRMVLFRRVRRGDPKSILVYRTARLGDFIVALPALQALRSRFPAADICLLTTCTTNQEMLAFGGGTAAASPMLPWLELLPRGLVNRTFVFGAGYWRKTIQEIGRLISQQSPEAAYLLTFSLEGFVSRVKKMVFLWAAGIRCPIYGWRVHSTAGLMRDVQYRMGRYEHQVWGPLRAIMEDNSIPRLRAEDVTFPIARDDSAEKWAEDCLHGETFRSRPVVAIFPGGTFLHKQWPPEHFVELCRRLRKECGVSFVVLGDEKDTEVCAGVCGALDGGATVNLVGRTGLLQLAALLRRCDLFVGNDSGPAHLASAIGCKTVTIFSSIEYPGSWEPWNHQDGAIRRWVSCAPCYSHFKCPRTTMECIRGITVDEVYSKCIQFVQTRAY